MIRCEARFAGPKSTAAFLPPGSSDWTEIKELTPLPTHPHLKTEIFTFKGQLLFLLAWVAVKLSLFRVEQTVLANSVSEQVTWPLDLNCRVCEMGSQSCCPQYRPGTTGLHGWRAHRPCWPPRPHQQLSPTLGGWAGPGQPWGLGGLLGPCLDWNLDFAFGK